MIRSSGWTRAVIGSVSEDRLKLEYPFELRSEDRFVNRWSVEIAPHKSKTEEAFEFKSKIEIDQQIDAFDDAFKWLKATVVNIKKPNSKFRRVCSGVNPCCSPILDERATVGGYWKP